MIRKFVDSIATPIGITLSQISVVDGKKLGCCDTHLLQIYSEGNTEGALLYQRELEDLQDGIRSVSLEKRIRAALLRLERLSHK